MKILKYSLLNLFTLSFLFLFNIPYAVAADSNQFVCGVDKNNNGYLGDAGEYSACQTRSNANEYLCPIGKTSCNQTEQNIAVPPNKLCPPGTTLQSSMCIGQSSLDKYGHSILIKKGSPTAISPVIDCKIAGYTEKYGFIEYNAQQDRCIFSNVTYTCPTGKGNACVNDGSGYFCFPNKCINLDINKPVDEGDINGGMLVNDGKKTEEGICLDELYIFSGRGQRCLPSGVSTTFKNCCANKGRVLQDNVGSLAATASSVDTISKIYDVAEKGYKAYNAAVAVGKTVSEASSIAGSTMQGQMLVAFDPTSLAISVALYFAMEYFMQACDRASMETAMLASSGYCHYVGEYCKKKVPLLGCVQKANAYCCFNSKLARIIHEQGRPQLSTMGDFGTAKSPQCRGFTPVEFQSVDFSKIDLSEYIEDITKKAAKQIQGEISDTIKDFHEKTN